MRRKTSNAPQPAEPKIPLAWILDPPINLDRAQNAALRRLRRELFGFEATHPELNPRTGFGLSEADHKAWLHRRDAIVQKLFSKNPAIIAGVNDVQLPE